MEGSIVQDNDMAIMVELMAGGTLRNQTIEARVEWQSKQIVKASSSSTWGVIPTGENSGTKKG